jgi:threonine/homoserine/homoserine lactone efflux protein
MEHGLTLASLLAIAIASFVIVIVPGPTVTVIIANSLRDGARAGLLNVAGTQAGLVPMVLIVALGLNTVVALMADWFFWIKLAGAAYLVWLGYRLWRSDGSIGDVTQVQRPPLGYFWQGFLVIWSNPKALLFFGAFLPQFIDPAGNAFVQMVSGGLIFMAVATVFDSIYALLAGRAGRLLTRGRIRLVERISGTLLIGGGLWMASLRRI